MNAARYILLALAFVCQSLPRVEGAQNDEHAASGCHLSESTLNCLIRTNGDSKVFWKVSNFDSGPETLALECDQGEDESKQLYMRDILDAVLTLVETKSISSLFWSKLNSISVVGCPLKPIQRLDMLFISSSITTGLEHLKISNMSTAEFTVDPDAFVDRPNLKTLEISHQEKLRELPLGLFCPLSSSLIELNVTSNNFPSLGHVGLVTPECQMSHLAKLDLSFNRIVTLRRRNLPLDLVPRLTWLDLSHNGLQMIEEASLEELGSTLEVLNLSFNQMSFMPVNIFGTSPIDKLNTPFALREFYVQNNSLAGVPSNLLRRLSNVVIINLSRNAITNAWLDAKLSAFEDLKNLVVLDLSFNGLTTIHMTTFRGLSSLRVLRLRHNRISALSVDAFRDSASTLSILELSHNHLESLPNGLFDAGFSRLSTLALDNNGIKALSRDLFKNATALTDLSLASNRLRHVPLPALRAVRESLRTVDLGENLITEVSAGAFSGGFSGLYGLRMSGNRIRALSADAFRPVANLTMLNLAHNQIERIEQDTFKPLKKLKALRLDSNRIKDLNGLLASQYHLQWLNVSHNQLQWFDFALIPQSLLWLDLQGNQIEEINNYYKIYSGYSLLHLDISHNRINRFDANSVVYSLREIDASDNLIATMGSNVLVKLANLTSLDLRRNRLAKFPVHSISLALDDQRPQGESKVDLLLSGNPIECDCDMEWISRINDLATKSPREFPLVADLSSVTCLVKGTRSATSNSSSVARLKDVNPEQFLCEYETHCFALCNCCDFLACDCRMKCSDGCHCFRDQTWSNNVIQCTNTNANSVPDFIPMDASVIFLDGNYLQDLSGQNFAGRKHLTKLFLNHSNVMSISNKTFSGLIDLTILHLHGNQLTSLSGGEFTDLVSLRELRLDHNELVHLAANTFSRLGSLEILTLHDNKLVSYEMWQLFQNPLLEFVSLADNPWSCDCGYLAQVQKFLLKRNDIIMDRSNLSCIVPDSGLINRINNSTCIDILPVSFRPAQDPVSSAKESEIVNEEVGKGEEAAEVIKDEHDVGFLYSIIPVIAIVSSSFIMVISLIILAVAFRKSFAKWLSSKQISSSPPKSKKFLSNSLVQKPLASPDFDVYVHYCLKDNVFVLQSLFGPLEASGLRVILHHRDVTREPDAIDSAVSNARRVIVVASPDYLRSDVARQELSLLLECMKTGSADKTWPDRLMVLSLSSTDSKHYLRRNFAHGLKCRILRWSDANFWQKMRNFIGQAHGHVKEVSSSSTNATTTTTTTTVTTNGTNDYEDDMWTFVKATNSPGNHEASNNTTTLPLIMPRNTMSNGSMMRSNVIVNPLQTSSNRFPAAATTARLRSRPEIPLSEYAATASEHIYHSLDLPPQGHGVYINNDLELVLPTGGQPRNEDRYLNMLGGFEDEELLMEGDHEDNRDDDDEDDDFSGSYVPSPAPGSMPRPILPGSLSSRPPPPPSIPTSSSSRRAKPPRPSRDHRKRPGPHQSK